jgi:hypothetical protein
LEGKRVDVMETIGHNAAEKLLTIPKIEFERFFF